MLVFLLVALSVYGLINFYIVRRGWQALAGHPGIRWAFLAVILFFILSFPAARILMNFVRSSVPAIFVKLGSFHLALMLYLFMGAFLVDLGRVVNHFFPFVPKSFSSDPHRAGLLLFLGVTVASVLTIGGGIINAARPRVRELSYVIDKPAGGRRTLTIVMASDVHLGTVAGSSRLQRLVSGVNALDPDIVLLPGDIVDESVTAREEEAMTEVFQKLRAPLGVYSVPGNHEYYGGLERNLAYLRKWGVRVLEDEAEEVAGSFYLIGRKDPSSLERGQTRMPIGEIMNRAGVDRTRPLILMDHQPVRLGEAAEAGIDLQLSGHTHAGQLFPLNLVNRLIYEQNWGGLRKGRTQYYVSCGVGTWGPPVRTGSIPEILRIKLSFKERP
jgi:predicted MPP superfamily phosphohydrolase